MASRIGSWWNCCVAVAALLAPACAGKDDTKVVQNQPGESQLEQSCEKTADCVAGLACVGGTCTSIDRKLTPNNNECAIVQCSTAQDCCANFTPVLDATTCATYNADCTADPVTYASLCTIYQQDCVCDASKYTCDVGVCTPHTKCNVDGDCGTGRCVGAVCVQCAVDTDCLMTEKCDASHTCVPKCSMDSECAAFEKCNSGSCVYVGCQSDRECLVSSTGAHPGLGFCDTSQMPPQCALHCGTDVDCVGLDPVTHTSQVCSGGRCVSAGCEDADECKILLNFMPTGNAGKHVECRPRTN